MNPECIPDRRRLEWIAVAVVTAIGLGLRVWPMGRLGLTHFDEGIYALVASWSLQPKGIAALDPLLIAYAPPGYPILGGIAYWIFGRSDSSMILVSQVAGTLTIPVVAWLGRRTFGPGAGFASAVFCATSGPHIAFSRMALVDASFLFAWLVALGAGMRFLERPVFSRALPMGLAVGLAQQFKYNGWLSGGIVVATALLGIVVRPEERTWRSIARTFGWGLIAAGVAWLVVWPWYAFVEAHGGYSALLRHQRSYLGSFGDWWPNFRSQAEQAVAMSGGLRLVGSSMLLVGLGLGLAGPLSWLPMVPGFERVGRPFFTLIALFLPFVFIDAPFRLGFLLAPFLATRADPSRRLMAVWWIVLASTSPFYHPYARLWLPLHAVNWLLMAWLVTEGIGSIVSAETQIPKPGTPGFWARLMNTRTGMAMICGACILVLNIGWRVDRMPDLLDPSDSLRQASRQVAAVLPGEVKGLQLLVRPPVTYYLAGRIALFPMAGSGQLKRPSPSNVWALVDSAILRSESGQIDPGFVRTLLEPFAKHWEVVEEFPTTLSLPTLLDLDPGAARSGSLDRSCPLWLLRPRRPSPTR